MEEVFNECVAERTAAGATVLLSSHILSEVERLADRVTIIREGRPWRPGTLEDLRHLHRSHVRAEVSGAVPDLTGVPGVHDVSVDGRRSAAPSTPTALPAVLEALTAGRRTHPDQHAADARGALPRRLPRGHRTRSRGPG